MFKDQKLPLARIKKIMKSDEEVRVCHPGDWWAVDDLSGSSHSVCEGMWNVHSRDDSKGILLRRQKLKEDSSAQRHRCCNYWYRNIRLPSWCDAPRRDNAKCQGQGHGKLAECVTMSRVLTSCSCLIMSSWCKHSKHNVPSLLTHLKLLPFLSKAKMKTLKRKPRRERKAKSRKKGEENRTSIDIYCFI